jgi:uncharacterized protein YggU (UPF0235/DUF167 family)
MGPRRTTVSFSSEDAPELAGAARVYVYYCRHSGRHALTTTCSLASAPRRRADRALVVDTAAHAARLYAGDGGVKLIRRRGGMVEKQYRLTLGPLPIGYRTEPDGRYLYIFDDALTTHAADEGGGGGAGGEARAPVPPCIVAGPGGGCRVALELEDRAPRHAVLKVSADAVRLAIKASATAATATEEVLEFMRTILGAKLGDMALGRGETPRHKVLSVAGVAPADAFERFAASALRSTKRRPRVY